VAAASGKQPELYCAADRLGVSQMADIADKAPTLVGGTTVNGSSDRTPVAADAIVTTAVTPGTIDQLIVPREDINAEITPSEELVSRDSVKIRKITKVRWFGLNRASELTTRLLVHKANPDSFDEDNYFVNPSLRHNVQDAMHDVRVFVIYSLAAKAYGLWIVKVIPGLSWYESLEPILSLPVSYFKEHEIRIKADRSNSRYRVFHRPAKAAIEWLPQTTEELLGAALGEDHFIRSESHPVYSDLTGGQEL
jgi:hypothetical protein